MASSDLPFSLPDNYQSLSLRDLSAQLTGESASFSISTLLAIWSQRPETQTLVLVVTTNPDGLSQFLANSGIPDFDTTTLLDFLIQFVATFRVAAQQDREFQVQLTRNKTLANQFSQLLHQAPPSDLNLLILWVEACVEAAASLLLEDAPENSEPIPPEPDDELLLPNEDFTSSDSPASTPPPPPSSPSTAVVGTGISISPSTPPSVENTSKTNTPLQIISVNNAFARNHVAAKVLQTYGLPSEDTVPWDQLSPQMQYLISRDLQGFLYGLDDQQLQNLNREAFVELFFQDLRQRHPFILQPDFALRQPEGAVASDSNVTPLTQPDSAASRLTTAETEKADAAYADIQGLREKGYFDKDLNAIERELADDLKAYGLADFEVKNLQNLAHYVTALGSDPNTVWYGANREELVTTFPFLSGQSNDDLAHIIGKINEYTWRQSGLIAKTLERPNVAIPQEELPSPTISDKLANTESLELGVAREPNSSSGLSSVVDAALAATPGDDEYQGILSTIALQTSAAERASESPHNQAINRRVLSVYHNPHDVEVANRKINRLQVRLYETGLEEIAESKFSLFDRRLQNLYFERQAKRFSPQIVFTSPEAALADFNSRMSQSRFAEGQYESLSLIAYLTPYEIISEGHDNGFVKPRYLPGSQKKSRNIFNFFRRGGKDAIDMVSPSPIRKARAIVNALSKAKKAIEGAKKLTNLAKLASMVWGAVSPLVTFLLGTPIGWLITGGLSALGIASLLSSALSTGTANAAPAVQALGQQATTSLTEGLKTGMPQAKAAAGEGGTSGVGKSDSLLSNAGQGVRDYLSTATPTASSILGVGGMVGLATVGLSTINGSFYKPLNSEGEVSPYVDIVKESLYEGNVFDSVDSMDGNMEVTYRIFITPKGNYTLTISDIIDDQSIDFNEEKIEGAAPDIPTVTRSYQGGDFPDLATSWTSQPQLSPGQTITIEYQQTFTPEYMNSAFFNEVKVLFDATDENGETVTGEVATLDHQICFGECPVLGQKCWPTRGRITQNPFDSPSIDDPDTTEKEEGSHADGGDRDAFDIAAPPTQEVFAPFDGRLCKQPYMDPGYGNWLTLDQVSGGKFNQLIFAHMSRTYFDGQLANTCEQITRGTPIGYVGSSGGLGSTGNHLHYGSSPAQTSSVVRQLVPDGDNPNNFPIYPVQIEVGVTNLCSRSGGS